MKKLKKYFLISIAVTAGLVIVLITHIWWVTRPAANEQTIAMARIDIKNNLTEQDASRIATWLDQQNGVDRVLCNTKSRTVVFSFYPVKADADKIAENFANTFHWDATRYLPSEQEMAQGCPAFSGTWTDRVAAFLH